MSATIPGITLEVNDELHGFVVEEIASLPEVRSVAYRLTHKKSGAKLLHLHNEDPENLFAAAFRTPPPDNTGLPHILEHTVLCGSKKYPVKDPFVELLKTSLATFLNAMTYPDKTVYPCASMNEKDYFNLVDVYCDAVFNPLITERHFKQEGHHFNFAEPGNTASPLVINGIVYNEMKGAFSDLDGIIQHKTKMSICPDNAYGLESGGDPEYIPALTYEQFVGFHKTYYHPSNSLLFLSGNIPTKKHLLFLDREYLSAYDRISTDTTIASQLRWSEPRRETIQYPIGPNDDPAKKAAVALAFLTNNVTDTIRSLSLFVLDDYLLGNAASPLRKALIDSKLGEELISSGYFGYQRDTYFCVGLKGTEPDRVSAITDLIISTCSDLVRDGLDEKKIEATFHRLELSSREIGARFPLQLMDRVYRTWLYDADPLDLIRLNKHLAELRRRYKEEPGYFERQLSEMIVDNPHYNILSFIPDREYISKNKAAFTEKMEKQKASMSIEALDKIVQEAEELSAMQSAPNTPEALATLPRLALSDVPVDPPDLSTSVEKIAGQSLLYTDIFSNGLSYLSLAFDLRGIDEELIDYLPVFTEALRKMGAAGLDYVAMAEREAAATGGFATGVSVGGRQDNCHAVQPYMVVVAKALDTNLSEMLSIIEDRTRHCDFTDLARLKDILLQGRIQRQSDIVSSGNFYASHYAARNLSRNCAISERLDGVTQLGIYNRLVEDIDNNPDSIIERLSRIRDFILGRGKITASFVGEESQRPALDAWLEGYLNGLPDIRAEEENTPFEALFETREGLAAPADVAFVASVLPTVSENHPDAPALLFLSVHLSFGYLWSEVRVKRGAYGVQAGYNSSAGVFSFSSFRDPCIKETLDAFKGVFQHINTEMDLSDKAMEQSIIGSVKSLGQQIRPGQAVGVSLSRYLTGRTPETRKKFRQRLLSLTGDDIRRVGEELLAAKFDTAPVCVLSSRERLTAANETLSPQPLTIIDVEG